jgi:hypothetical protein
MSLCCTLPAKTTSIKKQPTSSMKSSLCDSAKLGLILVNKKTISQAQLESALIVQFHDDKKLGELLVEQHLICCDQLEQALKEQYWRRNGYWVI